MLGGLIRLIRPVRLIKRKGLISGLFGGNKGWLALGGTVWFFGKVRELIGFGEPEPVLMRELKPGERLVLAHAEPAKGSRRRGRKR